MILRRLALRLCFVGVALTAIVIVDAVQICPPDVHGVQLTCPLHCCENVEGGDQNYFCCGIASETKAVFHKTSVQRDNSLTEGHASDFGGGPSPSDAKLTTRESGEQQRTRQERYATYQTSAFQVDYTLLVLGLIASIILSVLLSFLCCLLCNGCWLHRRRNPHMYETVNDSGFYPICCGFGIPLGTVVFSTHPPQFNNGEMGIYNGSTASSVPSSRNRVRFNEDGTPKGVLKNGQHVEYA